MGLKKDLADARASWAPLSFYEKFEHACILILTALIALIIALAIWSRTNLQATGGIQIPAGKN